MGRAWWLFRFFAHVLCIAASGSQPWEYPVQSFGLFGCGVFGLADMFHRGKVMSLSREQNEELVAGWHFGASSETLEELARQYEEENFGARGENHDL